MTMTTTAKWTCPHCRAWVAQPHKNCPWARTAVIDGGNDRPCEGHTGPWSGARGPAAADTYCIDTARCVAPGMSSAYVIDGADDFDGLTQRETRDAGSPWWHEGGWRS